MRSGSVVSFDSLQTQVLGSSVRLRRTKTTGKCYVLQERRADGKMPPEMNVEKIYGQQQQSFVLGIEMRCR